MARKGWVKLWHKLADDPLWLEEPFTKGQAWVDLLLLASTPDSERPGAVNCSLRYLARRWKWSKDKVRRFLARLERDGTVFRTQNGTRNGTGNGTLLTIVKYRRYQIDRTPNGTEDGTENEPKSAPKEEDKEAARRAGAVGTGDRKLPDVIRDAGFESWDEYNEWRRRNT